MFSSRLTSLGRREWQVLSLAGTDACLLVGVPAQLLAAGVDSSSCPSSPLPTREHLKSCGDENRRTAILAGGGAARRQRWAPRSGLTAGCGDPRLGGSGQGARGRRCPSPPFPVPPERPGGSAEGLPGAPLWQAGRDRGWAAEPGRRQVEAAAGVWQSRLPAQGRAAATARPGLGRLLLLLNPWGSAAKPAILGCSRGRPASPVPSRGQEAGTGHPPRLRAAGPPLASGRCLRGTTRATPTPRPAPLSPRPRGCAPRPSPGARAGPGETHPAAPGLGPPPPRTPARPAPPGLPSAAPRAARS